MAAAPIGFVAGGLLTGRVLSPARRDRLIRPLAVLSAVVLVPAIAGPPPSAVAALVGLSGVAQGIVSPTLNSKFVLILRHGYRARAYGVVQTGMQAQPVRRRDDHRSARDHFWLPMVVGLWSIGGTVAMIVLATRWPSQAAFTAATDEAAASNAAAGPEEIAAEQAAEPVLEPGLEQELEPAPSTSARSPRRASHPSAPDRPGATRGHGWQDGRVTAPVPDEASFLRRRRRRAHLPAPGRPVLRGRRRRPAAAPALSEEDLGPAADRLTLF